MKHVRHASNHPQVDGCVAGIQSISSSATYPGAFRHAANTSQVVVQRFKGLGEMNAEQLWETTMDPNRRTLLKVTVDDAAEADRTFDMLMGNSVPPRRNFITRHAREVRNLDI